MVLKATFNNISVISWLSVLLVEETWVPGESHRPVASHLQTLSHNVASSKPRLCWIRTHKVSGDIKCMQFTRRTGGSHWEFRHTFRTFHCILSIKDGLNWYTVWWKESLNSDGQHFSQYNKTNHNLSPQLIEHTKRPRHMTLEIQINMLMVFQHNCRSIIRSITTITYINIR
jgi:hypothetical protein